MAASCCGAGVAADADVTTMMMSSNSELHALNTGRPPPGRHGYQAAQTDALQGHLGTSLIVGGVDVDGVHLYSIFPHGGGQYRYPPGTTAVLTKTVTPLPVDLVDESVQVMQ
ncbi:Proteasome subunit beta type-7 [Merluccius polli]|uniref:Proteasome subunit beta type-7 n=1 Tax=Merluccius polli TaxID=89951 RepID=A0AA47M8R2_MERPO|nr:Proteasome subunit beta type-7 [Merluccius polli]